MALTRKQAISSATNNGMSRKEAAKGYRSLRKTGRDSGMSGKDSRDIAGQGIVAMSSIEPVELYSPEFGDTIEEVQVIPSSSVVSLEVPRGLAVKRTVQQRPDVLTFQGDFETAFGNARKMGEKEFYWNGQKYNTNLASPEKKKGLGRKIIDTIVEAGERPNTTDFNQQVSTWYMGRPHM